MDESLQLLEKYPDCGAPRKQGCGCWLDRPDHPWATAEHKPHKRLRCRLGIHRKTTHRLPDDLHEITLKMGAVGWGWRCECCGATGVGLLAPRLHPAWPVKGRR